MKDSQRSFLRKTNVSKLMIATAALLLVLLLTWTNGGEQLFWQVNEKVQPILLRRQHPDHHKPKYERLQLLGLLPVRRQTLQPSPVSINKR